MKVNSKAKRSAVRRWAAAVVALAVLTGGTVRPTAVKAEAQAGTKAGAQVGEKVGEKVGGFDFTEKTLANGLRVIVLEDPASPVVSVKVWYHVGSKDEEPGRQGFAHMFEHMMFRGTERLGPKAHFELIRNAGGDCNAYTYFDQTVYENKLPANQLELALWLEAERMAFLKIDDESFNVERAVVEEERRQGLNAPYGTLFERVMPQIFKSHPYRWTPIGRIPHLRRASIDELARFWERYYVPNNATLVVVGNVNKADTLALAEKYFGWIPRGEGEVPRVTVREPEQKSFREIRVSEPTGPLRIVGPWYRTVPMANADAVAIELASTILASGESSRMYRAMVKEKSMAVDVSVFNVSLEHDGLSVFQATLKPEAGEKETQAAIDAISDVIEAVKKDGVTAEELEKAKANLLKAQVSEAQTADRRAELLGQYAVLYGDLARVNRRFDDIRAVSLDDIKRVVSTYFVPERENRVIVEPIVRGGELMQDTPPSHTPPPSAAEEGEVAPPTRAEGASVRIAERQGPKSSAARPASFPDAPPKSPLDTAYVAPATVERTLANGLRVVVLPRRELPLVNLFLGVRNGASSELPSGVGHASMSAQLITQGTENYTSRELAETLDRHAITLGGSVSADFASVSAQCLSDHAALAAKLLAEVVRRPVFPESEFERVRQQSLANLSVQEQDPEYLANRELARRIYGPDHPYGRNPAGESADVEKLTRDGVAGWWKSYIRPDAAVLYVSGDIAPEDAFKLAEQQFGDWKPAVDSAPTPAAVPPIERAPTTIYLVDRPGLVQSQIAMGQLAITRRDPAWPSARVLTQVFGGAFGSRLNESVRVQKGLTYGIFGGFAPQKNAGVLTISTFSKTASTAATVRATLDEVAKMRTAPAITDEEATTGRSFLLGSFAGDRETPAEVVQDLWLIDYAGLPKDYMPAMLAGVGATTREQLDALATRLMDERQMTIVVVGDASQTKADLEKIAPVVVIKQEPPATQP